MTAILSSVKLCIALTTELTVSSRCCCFYCTCCSTTCTLLESNLRTFMYLTNDYVLAVMWDRIPAIKMHFLWITSLNKVLYAQTTFCCADWTYCGLKNLEVQNLILVSVPRCFPAHVKMSECPLRVMHVHACHGTSARVYTVLKLIVNVNLHPK